MEDFFAVDRNVVAKKSHQVKLENFGLLKSEMLYIAVMVVLDSDSKLTGFGNKLFDIISISISNRRKFIVTVLVDLLP